MKSFALLVLVLGACAGQDDHDDVPVEPSGQTPPTPPVGGTSGGTLSGHICVSTTLDDLTQCRQTDLGGFTVALGGSSTITDDSGAFRLPTPTGSLLSFTVSGPRAVTTTTPFSPSLTVPVIDADVYAAALASNQIFAKDGQGAIMGSVRRNDNAAQNVIVSSTPNGAFTPFYDVEGGGFGTNATGARGVFWVPGLATGSAALQFTDAAGGETTVAGVQVVNGGVTILDSLVLP